MPRLVCTLTSTAPVAVGVGATAVISDADTTVTLVAATEPKSTDTGVELRLSPLIVTVVPAGPEVGERLLSCGEATPPLVVATMLVPLAAQQVVVEAQLTA